MGGGDGLRFRFDCVALVEESSSDASVASESGSPFCSTVLPFAAPSEEEAEATSSSGSSALLLVAGGDGKGEGEGIAISGSTVIASFALEVLRGDPAFFGLSFVICFGRSLSGAIEAREDLASLPVA